MRRAISAWSGTGVALALALAACTGPRGSTSAGSSASGNGSSTGASSSGTSGGAASSGTSGGTGASDGGCRLGAPGGLPEGSLCLFPFDCACGLACGNDVSGVSGNLVCEYPCVSDADCPLPGEHCEPSLGFCQGGLSGSCAASSANLEFYHCLKNADCPCPLECYGDPRLGPACERPCNGNSACADAGQFCNVQVGSCQESCDPQGLVAEFGSCTAPTECICPFSCFQDPRRGGVCEHPCNGDHDCAADETCESDAGSCQRTTDCFGGGRGLPAFSSCVHPADCACPLACVDDPELRPPGSTEVYRFCEQCDGGACQSVSGACRPPGDGGYQGSDVQPCRSNSDCTCPNQCLPSADAGDLRCEQACATTSDCIDPAQFCLNAECVENFCHGQLLCDRADGLEDPPKVGDGTCLRLPPYTRYLCRANGTSRGGCDPMASQSDTTELCASGLACILNPDDAGNVCARACAVDTDCGARGSCAPTGLCLVFDDAGPCPFDSIPDDGGVCEFPGCTAPDGGEFQRSDSLPCENESDACLCPNVCIATVGAGFFTCEQKCSVSDDCLDPGQRCSRGDCIDNVCQAGAGPLCDLAAGASLQDAGRGTCLPAASPEGLQIDCTAPGTATEACAPLTARANGAQRCALGFGCVEVSDGGFGCLRACLTPSDCGGSAACIHTPSGLDICLPLDDAGACALGQSSPPASGLCGVAGADPCGCGYDCVDAGCALRCQRDSDCSSPGDICVGTIAVSYCVPGGG